MSKTQHEMFTELTSWHATALDRIAELEIEVDAVNRERSRLLDMYQDWKIEIKRLEAEKHELLCEIRQWFCEKCRTIYPGPPQEGFKSVICPKCGGPTHHKLIYDKYELKAKLDELQGLWRMSKIEATDD